MAKLWTKDGCCPMCGSKMRRTTFGQACRACPYDRYGTETQAQAVGRCEVRQDRRTDESPDRL